ncbi:glycosyltransferase family 39 protein [Candidatus Woesearchaeota archaeon]|nr:glycosyltransferase family 39 protein [Candidatus Woesearchaeota archaeon]
MKIASLFVHQDLWWDSSVYANMGKYLYSFGKSGLWEASRPLIWPLMLGFLWKIGIDFIFFGKLLVILFSLGCSVMTYLISSHLFSKKTAFYSALLFTFSPTFFLFNNILYSDIPSTFFLLIGVYFFIKKKHNYAGLFFGISFMTRFFQIFFIFPVLLSYAYQIYKKKINIDKLVIFLLFFLIPVAPFLLFNLYLYKNPFYPFILQSFMTKYTGWIFYQPSYFYLVSLIKENLLAVFLLAGFYIVIKKGNFQKKFILTVFIAPFILYNLSKHKEMRLLMPLFPFFYILVSAGMLYFAGLFKKNKNIILALLLLLWLAQTATQLRFDRYEDSLDAFYNYAGSIKTNDGIWISNPSFIIFSDKKAEELMYYPLYDSKKAKELQAKADRANNVMINTCDILPCPPDDNKCLDETDKLIGLLSQKLKLRYNMEKNKCKYLIFEK